MIRLALGFALGLAVAAVIAVPTVGRSRDRALALEAGLAACRETIATRKGIEDALDRLPTRPDLVLERLRELTGAGPGSR